MEPSDHVPDGREARLRFLDLGRALTTELDLDAVLQQILDTARVLTGARFAAVGILDGPRRGLAEFITSGLSAEEIRDIGHLPRGHGILGLLIDQPEPIRLHDVSEHPRSYGFPLGHPPMHGFLGAPIRIRGVAWGNIYLTEKEGGADFDDDDIDAIVVLADWAAVAIHNARLFLESEVRRTELERVARAMQASADIALAVGGEMELTPLLELIAKRARALVKADALLVLLCERGELHVVAHAGNAHPVPGAVVPIAGSLPGLALTTHTAQRVDDVPNDGHADTAMLGMPQARSALLVPLVFRGHALGVLVAVDHLEEHPQFEDNDEQALLGFAASAATAVSAARMVEAQRLRFTVVAAEEERKRWARNLHDGTLQGLGAIMLTLSSVLPRTDAGRPILEAAIEQLAQEITGLREIITDLRPAALDELGLEPALRTMAGRIGEREGLTLHLAFDLGEERLPADVETVAYRITQEALHNVARHAAARTVSISATCADRVLRVRIVDDGRGLDGAPTAGFGLRGMRERAALAAGEIAIESAHPGTAVTLTLPLGRPTP